MRERIPALRGMCHLNSVTQPMEFTIVSSFENENGNTGENKIQLKCLPPIDQITRFPFFAMGDG